MHREWTREEYAVSTDPARLDVDAIHRYLARDSYWAQNIPRAVLDRALVNSRCYGVYRGREMAAFGRVVTVYATFGYLCDVFVLPAHRGRGLSKWLVECILGDPDLQGFRNWTLYTKDAQGLYERFGFRNLDDPSTVMRIPKPDPYGSGKPGF